MFKFLIDECLSPSLASRAHSLGMDAIHVTWVNKKGYPDYALAPYAIGGDYVLVTNNGVDFKPIYRALDLHPGLIVIIPSVPKADQWRLFVCVVERLSEERDIVNKLVEIDIDSNITIENFPPLSLNL
jgi:predicted nuclease of predicted toxin-antitoxin system